MVTYKAWLLSLCFFLAASNATAKTAPSFSGELLGGGRSSLANHLKAGRVLFLSFWASWCVPCIEELRTVSQKQAENPSLSLDVLTVNVDTSETASEVKLTLARNGFKFPVVLDPTHEIFSKYTSAKLLPFSAVISAEGEILASFQGYHEEMFKVVEAAVQGKNAAHVP